MVTLDQIKEGLGESKEDSPADDNRAVAALLLGSARRRTRLRRILVAQLLSGAMGQDNDEDDESGERKLIGFLLGRRGLRRRGLRRDSSRS